MEFSVHELKAAYDNSFSLFKKEVNIERTEDALGTNATIIAAACPFCMTMLSDGVKLKDKDQDVKVLDIAEITARANGL